MIPLDKELYRFKRKGIDSGDESEVLRKVRRSENSEERERELRKKRRFFAPENPQNDMSLDEYFKNKMEQRSSRSSREDKDITAQGRHRFKNGIESSGSGISDTASGSGLWISQDPTQGYEDISFPKTADKRSAGINTLEKLVSALRAITIVPDEKDPVPAESKYFTSGSGAPGTEASVRKSNALPDFFSSSHSSGSGTEEIEESGSEAIQVASGNENELVSGSTVVRRELVGESLANELVAAAERASEQDIKAFKSSTGNSRAKSKRDALDEFMDASVAREKRAPILKATEIESSAPDEGDSLVTRFYRDQEMQEVESPASLPSEPELNEVHVTENHYSDLTNMPDPSVPKVIYKKQISKYHEPIIEMPAVYSQNYDDGEMDTSDGGSDEKDWDESEAPIEIHERHIEEDGTF